MNLACIVLLSAARMKVNWMEAAVLGCFDTARTSVLARSPNKVVVGFFDYFFSGIFGTRIKKNVRNSLSL